MTVLYHFFLRLYYNMFCFYWRKIHISMICPLLSDQGPFLSLWTPHHGPSAPTGAKYYVSLRTTTPTHSITASSNNHLTWFYFQPCYGFMIGKILISWDRTVKSKELALSLVRAFSVFNPCVFDGNGLAWNMKGNYSQLVYASLYL